MARRQPAVGPTPCTARLDTSLGFLRGWEYHYTQRAPAIKSNITDLVDLWDTNGPAHGKNGTYSAFLYSGYVVDVINAHDISKPLFVYMAYQNTHQPLEVPESYREPYKQLTNNSKRISYYGMATALDEGVGNITEALKTRGIYDNTLIVFSTDNGGLLSYAGCNYPLRGGKTDASGQGGAPQRQYQPVAHHLRGHDDAAAHRGGAEHELRHLRPLEVHHAYQRQHVDYAGVA